jgi:hypothetical protein
MLSVEVTHCLSFQNRTCSACTDQSRTRRYDQRSRAKCFPVSDHFEVGKFIQRKDLLDKGRNLPVDNIEAVQMLQCAQQLRCVESTPHLVEPSFSLQVMEQLSAVDEREHEIQLIRRLERELERDDERIVDFGEDRTFR